MKVIFTKKSGRTRMSCRRADGTFTSAEVGPSLPAHDFAHFIVERTFELPTGFFVNVANGYSLEQLSDAGIIRSLGPEPLVAEVLARALGELVTGACNCEQFPDRVAMELRQMGLDVPAGVSSEGAERMLIELQGLMRRFGELQPGESMELEFAARAGHA
ncbi:MAG TPA: hypothetical protein VGI35_10010 [Steroidobacteraceae bacterium]